MYNYNSCIYTTIIIIRTCKYFSLMHRHKPLSLYVFTIKLQVQLGLAS